MSTSSTNLSINEEDNTCIAALIVMGWEHKFPNLLIRPNNFNLDLHIGILESNKFVFVNMGSLELKDINSSCIIDIDMSQDPVLIFSNKILVPFVLDNSNDTRSI